MEEILLRDKVVLVIEDNTINQLVVKHSLSKLGAFADIASDGIEGIEQLQSKKYDLVLMDIQLPGMDGYEITGFIRNQLKSEVPILAMTAFALQGENERCIEAGMNGYVAKPFTIEELSASIKKAIETPRHGTTSNHVLATPEVAVDISLLYEIAGDDSNYINTMVSTFLDIMPVTIKKMEENIAEKDYDSLYRNAHYAKSSLSVVKISNAHSIVEQIERNARTRTNLFGLEKLITEVKDKFKLAEEVLMQKFGSAV